MPVAAKKRSSLVIGCGNRDRGDDAAGLIVAGKLRRLGVNAVACSGETSALFELWRTASDVIVVDSVTTGAPPGTIHMWDVAQLTVLRKAGTSTHGLGLAQAIDLARALHRLPRRLLVVGIEARNFEIGSHLSPEVQEAVLILVRSQLCTSRVSTTGSPSNSNTV